MLAMEIIACAVLTAFLYCVIVKSRACCDPRHYELKFDSDMVVAKRKK